MMGLKFTKFILEDDLKMISPTDVFKLAKKYSNGRYMTVRTNKKLIISTPITYTVMYILKVLL